MAAASIPCSALRNKKDNFRLVKLLPATDALRAPALEIEEHPRADCPGYTALSYCWGAASDPRGHVSVGDTSYEVSQTVEMALRHLTARGPRWLWIDQLCINQADDDEKSEQVQHMHHIYAEAEQTVAWLGPSEEGIDVLFSAVRATCEALGRKDYEMLRQMYMPEEENAIEKKTLISQAFDSFCARDYWTRLWVIQEFAVARHVVIMCGENVLDWTLFNEVMYVSLQSDVPGEDKDGGEGESENRQSEAEVGESPDESDPGALEEAIKEVFEAPAALSYVNSVFSRRERWINHHAADSADASNTFQRLLDVVTTSLLLESDYNEMHTSDDRDRIFALLNLANDKDQFPNFPDYSKTTEDVYVEAARLFIQQGHLEVLMCNQFPKLRDSLPSWAPDWSMAVRWPSCWEHGLRENLGDDNQPVVSFPGPGLLEIQGVFVDSIVDLGPTWDPDWRLETNHTAAVPYLQSIDAFCHTSQRVRPADAKHVAGRVAIAGALAYDLDAVGEGSADTCIRGLGHVFQAAEQEGTEDPEDEQEEGAGDDNKPEDSEDGWSDVSSASDVSDWYCDVLRLLHSRQPFLTSTGHVGVCSSNAKVGDHICIFSGSSVPYVLRPANNGKFALVGEVYVDGGMQGQLFQGAQERRSYILA